MAEPKKSSPWGRIAAVFLVIAAAGTFAILKECGTQRGLERLAGDPEDAVFVGETLLLIDHVAVTPKRGGMGTQANRVIALDIATGARLGSHVFGSTSLQTDKLVCWATSVSHVPCLEGHTLYVLDLHAIDQATPVADLTKSLGRPVGDRFTLSATDLIVALDDGRGARIDLATLAVTATTGNGTKDHNPLLEAPSKCAEHITVAVGSKTLGFVDGPLAAIQPIDPNAEADHYGYRPRVGKPVKSAEVPADAPRFLEPKFLDLGAVPPLFVFHRAKLDSRHSDPSKLTRLDDKLHVVWVADIGGDCQVARLDRGTIVIAAASPNQRAIAIDAATGAVRWQFAY